MERQSENVLEILKKELGYLFISNFMEVKMDKFGKG